MSDSHDLPACLIPPFWLIYKDKMDMENHGILQVQKWTHLQKSKADLIFFSKALSLSLTL